MTTDDDEPTTLFIKFMGVTHNMGKIDPEKMSTIVFVNIVMQMVFQRKLNFDERFKLTLIQSWDNDCTDIHGDGHLFSMWSLHITVRNETV